MLFALSWAIARRVLFNKLVRFIFGQSTTQLRLLEPGSIGAEQCATLLRFCAFGGAGLLWAVIFKLREYRTLFKVWIGGAACSPLCSRLLFVAKFLGLG